MKNPINPSTKKNIKALVKQGVHHKDNIRLLFEEIIQACREEFTEDNLPTQMSFLHEIFIEAARNKSNEPPTWLTDLFKDDLEVEYLNQLLQDKNLKNISDVYLAQRNLRANRNVNDALFLLLCSYDIIKEASPILAEYIDKNMVHLPA